MEELSDNNNGKIDRKILFFLVLVSHTLKNLVKLSKINNGPELHARQAVAPLGFSIDGFETFFERSKFPNFSVKTPNFYVFILNFPKN